MMSPPRASHAFLLSCTSLVALLALLILAPSMPVTVSAWNDRTHTVASVTAGSWPTAPKAGCTAMTSSGQKLEGGWCTVTSVRYTESGTAGKRTRNYHVVTDSNAGAGFIRLNLDLSTATGPSSSFSWSNAGLGHGHITPAPGWSCSSLPWISGDTASGGHWGMQSSVEFHINENRTTHPGYCV